MTDNKIPAVGSKLLVFRGLAKHTSGGLKRSDLMKTKKGRIVSRRQHTAGKKAIKRLFALGYKPKKGTFKAMHKHKKGTKKHSKKRGGAAGTVEQYFDLSGNAVAAAASKMAAK